MIDYLPILMIISFFLFSLVLRKNVETSKSVFIVYFLLFLFWIIFTVADDEHRFLNAIMALLSLSTIIKHQYIHKKIKDFSPQK